MVFWYYLEMKRKYRPRLADTFLDELIAEFPAIMIVGPRATGKTTTARRVAKSVVQLDRDAEAAAFHADPDAALRALSEPVLLDEWQVVPTVLGAVKRSVDQEPRPGRFLLTGSVRSDLYTTTWPGTGRLIRINMFGLIMREKVGQARSSFLDTYMTGKIESLSLPTPAPTLYGYIELALVSAFPEPALHLSPRARERWLDSYLEQLLTRDPNQIQGQRDPVRLRRYFEALALNSAGLIADKKLYDAAGVNAKTAAAYENLLINLLVLEAIPAWATNRLKRLVRAEKRYIFDPALIAAALRLDAAAVMKNGDLMGHIFDTFVLAQLRAEIAISSLRPRIYHLRSEQGRHEVDILIELPNDQVIAIEVKAEAAPHSKSARHLKWLRDQIGEKFLGGIVFHTGPQIFELDRDIMAIPICALWG